MNPRDLALQLRMRFCAGRPTQRANAVKIAMVNPDSLAEWLLANFEMTPRQEES